MVSVHVGDENAANLARFELTAQKLMLGTLATVKQPDLCPLG
jgi:hypothetical protein